MTKNALGGAPQQLGQHFSLAFEGLAQHVDFLVLTFASGLHLRQPPHNAAHAYTADDKLHPSYRHSRHVEPACAISGL